MPPHNKLTWSLARIAGWATLAGSWVRVFYNGQRPTAVMGIVPLAVAFLTVSITFYWIQHNRGIYGRKGARRAVPVVEPAYAQDRIGRPLHLDRAALATARELRVSIDEYGAKIYERVK